VRVREQTPAREREDGLSGCALVDLQCDVHHREPRADEQHRTGRATLEGLVVPGVAHVAGGIGGPGAVWQHGVARGQVAEREHDAMGAQALAAAERQLRRPAQRSRCDVDDLAAAALERRSGRGERLALVEQGLEIRAVDEPRHERRRLAGRIELPLRETQEMAGVVRQPAQARGGHVEQVPREARPVGHAPAHALAALDQHDACGTAAQQVAGEQRAACSGADDGDRGGNVLRVYEFARHISEYALTDRAAPVSAANPARNRDAWPGSA
jgi:hypothetical protein